MKNNRLIKLSKIVVILSVFLVFTLTSSSASAVGAKKNNLENQNSETSQQTIWYPESHCLYLNEIEILFTGLNQSGLIACPWFVNESSSELTGINDQFREYFMDDIKNVTDKYPNFFHYDNFTFDYIYTEVQILAEGFNFPYKYNSSEFNPYYCWLLIEYDFHNKTAFQLWNSTIALELESTLQTKWYIEEVQVIITYSKGSNTPFATQWVILSSLMMLIFWKRRFRIIRKSSFD